MNKTNGSAKTDSAVIELKKVLKKLDVSGIRIDHTNGW